MRDGDTVRFRLGLELGKGSDDSDKSNPILT